jgi:hypothetical protein
MKKSTRALIGLIVIEALLFAGAAWMVVQIRTGEWQTVGSESDAISTITSTAGAVMGMVAAILIMAFFIHRRKGN